MTTIFGLCFDGFAKLFFIVSDAVWTCRKVAIPALSILMFFFYQRIYPAFDTPLVTLVSIFGTWIIFFVIWILFSVFPHILRRKQGSC